MVAPVSYRVELNERVPDHARGGDSFDYGLKVEWSTAIRIQSSCLTAQDDLFQILERCRQATVQSDEGRDAESSDQGRRNRMLTPL